MSELVQNRQQLVKLLKAGDAKTYKYLQKKHFYMILDYIMRNSGRLNDAEDIFQEALVVLYINAQKPDFQLTSSEGTYIFAIAKNLWLDRLKKNKRLKVSAFQEKELAHLEATDDIAMKIEIEKKHELIIELIKNLGTICQEVLRRFYFNHEKLKTIGKAMGDGNSTSVRVRITRCRDKLRDQLREHPDY